MTEFDFSDTSVGDEYTFTVRQTGLDENPSVDGTVIEAVDDGTDDGDDNNVTDGDDGDDGNVTDGDDGDDGNVTDGDDGTDDGDDGTDDGDDGSDDGSDGSDGGDDGGDSEDGTPRLRCARLSSPSSRLRSSRRGVTSNAPATLHTR